MGIFNALRASVTHAPLDDFWYNPVGASTGTFANFPSDPERMMRASAVNRCVTIIAETLASLPCILYRRLNDSAKERARDHRLYRTLRYQPNRWMTPMDFFGAGQVNAGLRGNAVSEILDDGRTVELLPLDPDRTIVEQIAGGALRYKTRDANGRERMLRQESVLHVRDLPSPDLITGRSRAALAREAIAIAGAAEGYAGRFLANDGSGRVVVEHPAKLDDTTRKQIRENFRAGWSDKGRLFIAEGGVKPSLLGDLSESGFLVDPRKFQISDIARFWGVPGFLIGLEEKSTSFGAGIEQQKQGFVDFTIKPWLDRWAQAMGMALLDEDEREEYFIEFLLDDLLRGDTLATVQALAIERQNGAVSPNEWRAVRNRNPRTDPGGDEYQATPTGGSPNAPTGTEAPPRRAGPPPPDDEDEDAEARRPNPAPLLAEAAERIAGREVHAVGRRTEKAKEDGPKFVAWSREFYGEHRRYAAGVLENIAAAVAAPEWVAAVAADRIDATALAALTAEGAPAAWLASRQVEVLEIITDSFRAGAAAGKRAA